MSSKNQTLTRILKSDKEKLDNLVNELGNIQGRRISKSETLRRILNIPKLSSVLKQDAQFKRGINGKK